MRLVEGGRRETGHAKTSGNSSNVTGRDAICCSFNHQQLSHNCSRTPVNSNWQTTSIMSRPSFLLVSLPSSISSSGDSDEALTALRSVVSTDNGTTYPFAIPSFKIGTLDALVQQADDLTKLETGCRSIVEKVADSLRNVLEGDEEKIAQQKNVNDSA